MRRRVADGESKIDAIANGLRTRPAANGWIIQRAVDKLHMDRTRIDNAAHVARDVKHYTRKDTFLHLSNEERWMMAETIRRSFGAFPIRLKNEICAAAGVDESTVSIQTVTTESMFEDERLDEEYTLHVFDHWEDHVNPSFTGDISVIIDMESSSQNDVDLMRTWLKDTGVWRIFSVVDGPSASYVMHGKRCTITSYDVAAE
jgi:hypothetical protein